MREEEERHPSQVEEERLTTPEGAEVHVEKQPDGAMRGRIRLVGKGAQQRMLPLTGILGIAVGPQWVLQLSPSQPWWVTAGLAVLQVLGILTIIGVNRAR